MVKVFVILFDYTTPSYYKDLLEQKTDENVNKFIWNNRGSYTGFRSQYKPDDMGRLVDTDFMFHPLLRCRYEDFERAAGIRNLYSKDSALG
jgi:hypothetical protein